MTNRNHWYVITGGPCCGKTTLIDALAQHGYHTVPEAARLVIDEAIANGVTVAQLRADEAHFQNLIFQRKVAAEAAEHRPGPIFFDRGMHDTIAYNGYYGFSITADMQRVLQHATYGRVFLLDPIPDYQADYTRTESPGFLAAINQLLFDAYAQAGMRPVRVPVLPLAERIGFVLQSTK